MVKLKMTPLGMKIISVLFAIAAVGGILAIIYAFINITELFQEGDLNKYGTSTIVVSYVRLVDLFLLAGTFLVFSINALRDKRHYAAYVIYLSFALVLLGAICSLMLYGVDVRLIWYGVVFVILIIFQTYLDPNLKQERHDYFQERTQELKEEKEEGVLGRDLSGRGYIDLNFFNLFWIFVVASFLGDVIESIVHVTLVDPGHWQDRAGLLFGQFSPIYGCGAVLMTLFLNRLYNRSLLLIFLLSAVIGGAFEYFVSFFMQYTFGAVAWDYTGQFLSIDGRTCGWAMACWGLLGVAWLKILLPIMLKIVNLIPWNWRYAVTTIAAILMAIDCVMSLQALDCWYGRLAGNAPVSPIQEFYAKYFDNTFMTDRFQSMTIDPANAVRDGKV